MAVSLFTPPLNYLHFCDASIHLHSIIRCVSNTVLRSPQYPDHLVSAAIEVTLNANLHLVYASHNKGMPYVQADFISYVSYAVTVDIKRQKKAVVNV